MNIINEEQKHVLPVFKVDPIVVLVLGIITCGLYHIYWNLKVAAVFNALSKKEMVSEFLAIFAGCCFPLNLFFFYVIGKDGMPLLQERVGETPKEQSTMLLILGFIFPMVAAMIVQSEVNKLYEK